MARCHQLLVLPTMVAALATSGCAALSGATVSAGQYTVEVSPVGDTTVTLESRWDRKRRTLHPWSQYRWKDMEAYYRNRPGDAPPPAARVDRDRYRLYGHELGHVSYQLTIARPGYQPVTLEVRPRLQLDVVRGLVGDAVLGLVLPGILYFPVGDRLRAAELGPVTPTLLTLNAAMAGVLLGCGLLATLVDLGGLWTYNESHEVDLQPLR